MKSKHRHELETNELADTLNRWYEWAKPHANTISYGVLAVVALVLIVVILPSIRGNPDAAVADAFAAAQTEGKAQPLRDFLKDHPQARQVPAARLLLAHRLLGEVVRGVETVAGEDPKFKTATLLAEASDLYTQVAQSSSAFEPLARVGLALLAIQQGDLDQGRAALQEITQKYPNTPAAEKARAHMEALAGYRPMVFSDEPLEEPKKEETPAGGNPAGTPAPAEAPQAAPAPAESPPAAPAPAPADKAPAAPAPKG